MGKNKDFEEMICPVCGQYEFVPDTDLEMADPDYSCSDDWCPVCGWVYDLSQADNPSLENGKNEMCLLDYQVWYREKIKEDPEYMYCENEYPPAPHECPVCGKYKFEDENSFSVCRYCGWVDDAVMEEEPDSWAGNSNDLCLSDFKRRYEDLLLKNPKYKYSKDGLPN